MAQEEAETMRQNMESLRSRLDEKDIALESARARLDRLGPAAAARPEPARLSSDRPAAYYNPPSYDPPAYNPPAYSPPPAESRPEPHREDAAPSRRDDGEERRRYLQELLARREAEANRLRKP